MPCAHHSVFIPLAVIEKAAEGRRSTNKQGVEREGGVKCRRTDHRSWMNKEKNHPGEMADEEGKYSASHRIRRPFGQEGDRVVRTGGK